MQGKAEQNTPLRLNRCDFGILENIFQSFVFS